MAARLLSDLVRPIIGLFCMTHSLGSILVTVEVKRDVDMTVRISQLLARLHVSGGPGTFQPVIGCDAR